MRIFSFIFFYVYTSVCFCQPNPCDEFNDLNTKVRDGLIDRDSAREKIRELMPKIKELFNKNGGVESTKDDWYFPVEGYGSSAIGGVNGSGYIEKGFDYFDGNKRGGHPAHDIFIKDRNKDDIDDYTGKPVNILSVCNGIVIAYETEWEVNSDLRGGKYIYIYDPFTSGIFYYAHNREVFVKPGDVVTAGQVIAQMGRTGINAYKRRSPTHLHIGYLYVQDGYPKPEDIYKNLLNANNK